MGGSYWLLALGCWLKQTTEDTEDAEKKKEKEKDFENCHPERSEAESRDNAVAFVSSLSAACGLLTILKDSLCASVPLW